MQLHSLFCWSIEQVTILNPFNYQDYATDRLTVLDVKATASLVEIKGKTKDKAMYDSQEKARRDYEWAINSSRKEGLLEGKIEDKIEGEIKLIQTLQSGEQRVLVCVCSNTFDFGKKWLGVPYNEVMPYRSQSVGNCFGPTGSATVSTRDAVKVPALPIRHTPNRVNEVDGEVAFCCLALSDIYLQSNRIVIDSAGAKSVKTFSYSPDERICFEEGDAFFVGDASDMFLPRDEGIRLRYLILPRRYRGVNVVHSQ